MNIWDYAGPVATVLSFVLTAAGVLVTVTWRLSAAISELKVAIEQARDEVEADQKKLAREFGESVSAVRQKIHDVETWTRDTFARRDSFQGVVTKLENQIGGLGERIEKRLERLEVKIDNK